MSEPDIDQMPATDIELDRQNHEELCEHPWLNTVCDRCGLVIGMPRMHPEEI